MKLFNNKKGFTLVEIVVAMSLLTIVISCTLGFLNTSAKVSQSINRNAEKENALVTSIQTIRAELSNAETVEIVSKSELDNPETGYYYLYCDEKGGVSINKNGVITRFNTVDDLKHNKLFLSFKGCQADATGFTALQVNGALYAYDPAVSNAVSNDDGTFTQMRADQLDAIGTDYKTSLEINLHNLNRVNGHVKVSDLAIAESQQGNRAIKYCMPNPNDYLITNPSNPGGGTTSGTTTGGNNDSDDSSYKTPLTGRCDVGFRINNRPSGNKATGQLLIDNQQEDVTVGASQWSTTIEFDSPVKTITCAGNAAIFEISSTDPRIVKVTGNRQIAPLEYVQINVNVEFDVGAISLTMTPPVVGNIAGGETQQFTYTLNKPSTANAEANTWVVETDLSFAQAGYVKSITNTDTRFNITVDASNRVKVIFSGFVDQTITGSATLTYMYGATPPTSMINYVPGGEKEANSNYNPSEYVECNLIWQGNEWNPVAKRDSNSFLVENYQSNGYAVVVRSAWWSLNKTIPLTKQQHLLLLKQDENGNPVDIPDHYIWVRGYRVEVSPTEPDWGSSTVVTPPPSTPSTPDNPGTPSTPDNPGTPSPGTPSTPDNPDTPSNPDDPGTPSNPDNPDNPENPDEPPEEQGSQSVSVKYNSAGAGEYGTSWGQATLWYTFTATSRPDKNTWDRYTSTLGSGSFALEPGESISVSIGANHQWEQTAGPITITYEDAKSNKKLWIKGKKMELSENQPSWY